jgi:ribonuclease J
MAFPDDDMFGIDVVIPDFTYLRENMSKIKGLIITHAHEDHIGAVPYLLQNFYVPIYGTKLTLGFIRSKLREHRISADLREIQPGENIRIGCFKIEALHTTHSVADSLAFAITTPVGVIFHTGDFKMDLTPMDGATLDFSRIAQIGDEGVLLLMSDSTNVEREGFSDSERSVGYNLDKIFFNAKGRIILTSFASHVHRVQQAIWAAHRTGRKVAVCGRGMQNMVTVASQMGYLEIPDKTLIDVDEIGSYPSNRVVVLTTGSQGEPLSGLTRMASGEHKQVQIMSGDTVVISATPIPGNERTVARTVDNLFRLGANVIHERSQGIHVSGHACREELKVLLNMVKPRFFMPIHGEYRMLYKHALLAQSIGMQPENTIVMENGQVLELARRNYRVNSTVPSGRILIDGLGVGDVGSSVLRERRQLSEAGVIVISMVYTKNKGKTPKILCEPEVNTRGFIFEKEYEHIIVEIKDKVTALCTEERLRDGSLHELRNQIRSAVGKLVLERTGRRPVIMAAVNEV